MEIKFSKRIYTIQQIVKAAYVFTEQAYIHLDDDEGYIYVYLEPKNDSENLEIQGEFKNEVLAQVLRETINERTKNIRELIFQRALSSSMVMSETQVHELDNKEHIDFELESILKDWFEGEDEQ